MTRRDRNQSQTLLDLGADVPIMPVTTAGELKRDTQRKGFPIVDGRKICNRCLHDKPVAAFGRSPKTASGLEARCRSCIAAYFREKYQTNEQHRENKKHGNRKYRYDLDRAAFARMMEEQSGSCAICGAALDPASRDTQIDHCPKTKKVRALLCGTCNGGLVRVERDLDRVRRFVAYIEKHGSDL